MVVVEEEKIEPGIECEQIEAESEENDKTPKLIALCQTGEARVESCEPLIIGLGGHRLPLGQILGKLFEQRTIIEDGDEEAGYRAGGDRGSIVPIKVRVWIPEGGPGPPVSLGPFGGQDEEETEQDESHEFYHE